MNDKTDKLFLGKLLLMFINEVLNGLFMEQRDRQELATRNSTRHLIEQRNL